MGAGQSGFAAKRQVSLFLAGLGVILVFLVGAPRALAQSGVISGKVTNNAGTPSALSGIEVDLYDTSQDFLQSTSTAADGTYSFTALSAGKYVVGFQDSTNYAYQSQFYKGASSFSGATDVSITDTGTASGINAAMVPSSNVTGTVKNTGGTLLNGISVTLYDTSGNFIASTTTGATGPNGTTEPNGTYSFTGASGGCYCTIPGGTYVVGFSDPNNVYLNQFYNNQPTQSSATHIVVGNGSTSSGINATMAAAGNITGTVTNTATTPVDLSGIEVDLYDTSGNFLTSTNTAANGTYTFAGVYPVTAGNYVVGFTDPNSAYVPQFYNGKATESSATVIAVGAGKTVTGVNAKMARGANITGTVTNDAATPVDLSGIEVDLYDSSGNQLASTFTQANGTYTFAGTYPIPVGTYEVGFLDNSNVYLSQFYNGKPTLATATQIKITTAGQTATGVSAKLVKGAIIQGTVTNAASPAAPLANIAVTLYDSTGTEVTSTATAANGSYSFGGLPTGSYFVGFDPRESGVNALAQFYKDKPNLESATPIAAKADTTTTGINASLATGGQVTGTVTAAGTSTGLGGIEVTIYDTQGNIQGSTTTASNGTYRLIALSTGSYEVGFSDPSDARAGMYYSGKDSLALATRFGVTAGSVTSGINQALAVGGEISGTVTNNAATPAHLPGIDVAVFDAGGNLVAQTTTNSAGQYLVQGLAPGAYELGFSDPSGKYKPVYWSGQTSIVSANPVDVAAGATTSSINAVMAAAPPPPSTGAISGTVTNNATSPTPLQGIQVDIYNGAGSFVTSTVTAANGTYSVSSLPVGTYKVGFFSLSGNYLAQYYNDEPSLSSATAVTVSASKTTTGISAKLAPGGQISGIVTNNATTPTPLEGVEVDLYDASGNVISGTFTAANGTYSFPALPTGSYKVGFNPLDNVHLPQFWNDQPSLASATAISVTAPATTSGINAKLAAGGQISGTVTNNATTPAPLPNIEVDLYDGGGNLINSTFTAADGTYSFPGLATGTYKIGFSPAGSYLPQFWNDKSSLSSATAISVTAPGSVTGISAKLVLGGQITGLVSDASGYPLGGIDVSVYNSSGTVVQQTTTGTDGTYSLPGLPAGSYKVGFAPSGFTNDGGVDNFAPQYYNDAATLATATAFAVNLGQTVSGINAKLAPAGQISGTVTDVAGHPLEGVNVAVYSSGSEVAATLTDAGGGYSLGDLTPGSYQVGFSTGGFAPNYASQYYNDSSTLAGAKAVTVTAGANTTGINAALTGRAQITGTVTSKTTSADLSGVTVTVYNASGIALATATTGANGVYTATMLGAGTYKVGFTKSGYTPQFYNDQPTLAAATAVTVTSGATTSGIGAKLVPAGSISGTVTNNAATAVDLAGVTVTAYNSGGAAVGSATTASNGTYTLSNLAPGTDRVGFVKPGYVGQFYNDQPTLAAATAVTVTSGATTSGIGAKLVPAGSISGTVTNNAATAVDLAGVTVTAYNSGGAAVGSATTASNGTYTLSNLAPGTDRVGFVKPGYVGQFYNDQPTLAAATAVTVTSGATTSGIGAKLVPAGSISGTVTNNAATAVDLAGVTVTAYNSGGAAVGSATTASNGTYTLSNLAPGTNAYRVGFAHTGYTAQFYNDQSSLAAANTISVSSATTTASINAKLVPTA